MGIKFSRQYTNKRSAERAWKRAKEKYIVSRGIYQTHDGKYFYVIESKRPKK